jgi:hypothetical protein
MLTVKHIYPNGNEWTFEAEEVTRIPFDPDLSPPGKQMIFAKRPGGLHEQFTEGSCYVMNSSGATVSVHHLGTDERKAKLDAAQRDYADAA